MESLQARFQNLRELVGRQIGTRMTHDDKIFSSSHGVAGEASFLQRLPQIVLGPSQDLVTGEFWFRGDYDYIDGGNPIG